MPLTGRTLGGEWKIGPLLGRGDCAEVYECADKVIKVSKLGTKKEDRRKANTLFQEHLIYEQVCQRYPGSFPTKFAYGEEDGYRYLVMTRLGRPVTTKDDLGKIGVDILRALEALHRAGYAYVDMKPENLMMGLAESEDTKIRVVDFGLAQRYRSAMTGSQRDGTAANVGTQRYRGVESHRQRLPPSRQSDLEALAHVLLCLGNGDVLPWDDVETDEQRYINRKCDLADSKSCVDACTSFPSQIRKPMISFLTACRAMGQADDPDYNNLSKLAAALSFTTKRSHRDDDTEFAVPPAKKTKTRQKKSDVLTTEDEPRAAHPRTRKRPAPVDPPRRSPRRQTDRERRAATRSDGLKSTSREVLLAKARKGNKK